MEIEGPLIRPPLEALRASLRERRALCEEYNKILLSLTNGKGRGKEKKKNGGGGGEGGEGGGGGEGEGGGEGGGGGGGVTTLISSLTDGIEKINKIKRKLAETTRREKEAMNKILHRLQHLTLTSSSSSSSSTTFKRLRLERFLADYFARTFRSSSAAALVEEGGGMIEEMVDAVGLFQELEGIVKDIEKQQTSAALAWCAKHRSKLKRGGSKLEFYLRCQDVVEIGRKKWKEGGGGGGGGGGEEGVVYARAHLASWVKHGGEEAKMVMSVMAMLVFPPTTTVEKYKKLFSKKRWDFLRRLFLEEACRLNGLPAHSLLKVYLQAGLSALKTHQSGSNICAREDPMHVEELRLLSSSLPYAKHNNSKLLCSILATRMDEDNPPMVLPNGYVYSLKGIQKLIEEGGGGGGKGGEGGGGGGGGGDGIFYCPRTGHGPYSLELAKKAFIS